MALNNDIVDLTGAAGAADEFVVGGRVNQASGNLELDMNIGGNSAIQIPLLNNMPPDEYVTGARYNPGTGEVELDLCIAGARAITFQLLNQLPRDVYIVSGVYDPVTMKITFIYSDGRKNLELDLSSIVMYEKAGANYDPTHEYNTGDVVSVPGSKILYIALASGVLPDPVVSPAEWKAAGDIERGGVAWSATTQYFAGDIVTIASDDELYIAMADNINSDPLLRTDWYELGAARHIVGWYTPDGTNPPDSEYPDTTGQEPGAVWYTNGVDPDTGYVFTAGPFLGYTAHNNDKFVWYGYDASGHDIWLFEPFPRISGLERGGLQWKDSKEYKVDDIVAFGQIIYVANADNTNVNPVSGAEWTTLGLDERGGVEYNDTLSYNTGDIVSYNGSIYNAIVSVPPGHTPPDAAYWDTPKVFELGGREWDVGAKYDPGDIVTDSSNNKVYTALYTSIGDTPSTNPGIWEQVGYGEEHGGIQYDTATNYNKGDVAVDSASVPNIVYVSIQSNNTNHPLTDTNWWQELDSIFFNAQTGGRAADGNPTGGVLHNPNNPTNEYPDCSGEQEGAIWYITGLGRDANNDPIFYEFTTGPLTGVKVVDLDKIVWINGNDTTDCLNNHWLWSPFPRVSGEVGGVAWKTGWRYDKGDIVVDLSDFSAYKSTINDNIGNIPSSGSGWAMISPAERGGVEFATHHDYIIGDICVYQGDMYTCIQATTPGHAEDPSDTAYWKSSVPSFDPAADETGGLAWDATKTYQKGTMVTIESTPIGSGIINQEYISKVDGNIGNDPITDDTNWRMYNTKKWIDEDVLITVGPGGDFGGLQEVLDIMPRYSTSNESIITIKMLAGYEITTPIKYTSSDSPNIYIDSEVAVNIDVSFMDINTKIAIDLSTGKNITWFATLNTIGTISDPTQWNILLAVEHIYMADISCNVSGFSNICRIGQSVGESTINGNDTAIALTAANLIKDITVNGGTIYINNTNCQVIRAKIRNNMATGFTAAMQAGVVLIECDFRRDNSTEDPGDVNVFGGSMIEYEASTLGGINVTPNTLTRDGVIFKD